MNYLSLFVESRNVEQEFHLESILPVNYQKRDIICSIIIPAKAKVKGFLIAPPLWKIII